MIAVDMTETGAEDVLELRDVPAPELGATEIRIAVRASGVNRADLMQRQGFYPPPPGASPILGLECAGRVMEVGRDARRFAVGDRVMALLAGGGYAAEVCVDEGCAMPVPDAFSDIEAAGFPEVFLTVFLNLFRLGGLESGGRCLVHGGSSGIGTAAVALANKVGASIAVTAGTEEKCARCRELGADLAINYREADFVEAIATWTDGRGVDVVLDSIGAPYFDRNVACLSLGGRLLLIGLMGGARGEIDFAPLLYRRSPLIHRTFPISEAAEAHRLMKSSEHVGKIILEFPAES
jgi:putative PIG3 family NAD(P)H quinone oxidoreductase